jgi:N-acetylglutamate synthase
MGDLDLIAAIEDASYRSWPAREMVVYDGWQLRYADGFSRRGNTLLPIGPSSIGVDEKLDHCRDWFAGRGLDLVVRCTPLCEPGIDDELDRRGFSTEGETHVMILPLRETDQAAVPEYAISPEWWDTMAKLWDIGPHSRTGWRAIIERISLPTAHVLLRADDAAVGAGLGVLAGPWLGVFELVVRSDRRRQGHGRDMVERLFRWGESRGASHAYLQVVGGNEPARALYENLGFRDLYTYWYRRSPGRA